MATEPVHVTEMNKALKELKERFQSVDTDASGSISFKELKEMTKDLNLSEDEIQVSGIAAKCILTTSKFMLMS